MCYEGANSWKYDGLFYANVADLAFPGSHVLFGGLAVDVHDGDAGVLGQGGHGAGGRGLHQVHDQHVNAVGDEGVDLVGLGVLVVLAVHDGHLSAIGGLKVGLQLFTIQGHEVVVELIDADTNLDGRLSGREGNHAQHHDEGKSESSYYK